MERVFLHIVVLCIAMFPFNTKGQITGKTDYKYGDKALRKFAEKNISFPADAEKNGCVLLALVKFEKGKFDTVLTTSNDNFGRAVVGALMKTKGNWNKRKGKNILIPFYFIAGSNLEKIEMKYNADAMCNWNKEAQDVLMLSPVIITGADDKKVR
jgi:hypothetical protein